MNRTAKLILGSAVLFAFASSVFAVPQAGTVEGTILRSDNRSPVAGATITLSSGPMDPLSTRALQISAGIIGANFQPVTANGEEFFFMALSDAVASRGLSPGHAELTTALHNFREQTAKFKALTGSDGTFSVRDVPPGRYTVRAERDGYLGSRSAIGTIDVGAGGSRVSLSMLPGATMGGRIRDDDGDLLANATVQAFSVSYLNGFPTLTPAVTAKTNHRGEYRLFWLKEGDYLVAAMREGVATLGSRTFFPGTAELSGASTVPLKVGEDRDGVDFTLTNARIMKVSGELISTAPPPTLANLGIPPGAFPADFVLPNIANVMVMPRDPNTPGTTEDPSVGYITLEGNRGRFEFNAPPGAYELIATVEGGGSGRVAFDLANQDLLAVAVNIGPAVPVKGVFKTNGATLDLTRTRLRLQPEGKIASTGVLGFGLTPVAPDGSFALSATIPGRHRIEPLALPPNVYIADVLQGGTSVFESGIAVSSETPPVEVVLANDGGTLKGNVLDTAGKPVANATISLIPAEARRQNRSLYKVARTNAQGGFTIAAIPPGQYKVFAWRAIPDGSFYNTTFLARYEDKGKPVVITPAGTVEATATIANEP